jgi:hypothetical protein
MGQQKGNPTPSYQNQAYETLRPNDRTNRNLGTAPVMISHKTTLNEVVDTTFATDSALSAATVNLSASLEARISNLEQPSKAYNTSNTSYTPSNGGTVTFTLINGGDTRGYSTNEVVYFQKFDGNFTGVGTVTGYNSGASTLSVTQNSGGSSTSGNYWVISRYSM